MKKLLMAMIFVGALVLTVQPAHAYLDPGTGSMILQTLIATFVAAGIAVKSFWSQILSFFSWNKSKKLEDKND